MTNSTQLWLLVLLYVATLTRGYGLLRQGIVRRIDSRLRSVELNQEGAIGSDKIVSVQLSKEEIKEYVRKGTAPEFALPDDSTIETPYQRGMLATHFGITFINLMMAAASLHLDNINSIVSFIAVVIGSIILGDFSTGVFHWSVDNYGSIKTPIFGSVCVAFQGHHESPWTITFRSFANNVYKICYGTIPALTILSVFTNIDPLTRTFFSLYINWWLISQELHKYSHMRKTPKFVKILQDWGIILSKKEHGLHHTSPFEAHYCILTGICNPVLDKTNFFRYLERIIYTITKNTPNTWKADNDLRNVY